MAIKEQVKKEREVRGYEKELRKKRIKRADEKERKE